MIIERNVGIEEKQTAGEMLEFLKEFSENELREMKFFMQGVMVGKDLCEKKEERQ